MPQKDIIYKGPDGILALTPENDLATIFSTGCERDGKVTTETTIIPFNLDNSLI